LHHAVQLVAKFLEFNPRRIHQFVNVLSLRARLVKTDAGETAYGRPLGTLSLAKLIAIELRHPDFIRDVRDRPELLAALVLGAGEGTDTDAYRRWSAVTDLMELIAATMPADRARWGHVDAAASLLDVNLAPLLNVARTAGRTTRDRGDLPADPQSQIDAYAREYERIRTEPFTPTRSAKLDRLFDDISRVQRTARLSREAIFQVFETGREGDRIAGLALAYGAGQPWGNELAVTLLSDPQSLFEDYHALRLVLNVWPGLEDGERRSIARLVSRRKLFQPKFTRSDLPIWSLSESVLSFAHALSVEGDFVLEMPDAEPLRLEPSQVRSFDELTDRIFETLPSTVRAYHYGTDWWLESNGRRIEHAREIEKKGPGAAVADPRSLAEAGIRPGQSLKLVLAPKSAPTAGRELHEAVSP
jgi:hypothetical protein